MRNLKKQACGVSSAGFGYALIYFWFLLVGLSGSVIFIIPSATNGAMYLLVKLPISLYPKNAAISFFDLAVEQKSIILFGIDSWWFSWWLTWWFSWCLTSESIPGPTFAVAIGFNGIMVRNKSPSINWGSPPEYSLVYLLFIKEWSMNQQTTTMPYL